MNFFWSARARVQVQVPELVYALAYCSRHTHAVNFCSAAPYMRGVMATPGYASFMLLHVVGYAAGPAAVPGQQWFVLTGEGGLMSAGAQPATVRPLQWRVGPGSAIWGWGRRDSHKGCHKLQAVLFLRILQSYPTARNLGLCILNVSALLFPTSCLPPLIRSCG